MRSRDYNVAQNCLKCYFFFFIMVGRMYSTVCSALVFYSEHRLSVSPVEKHYGMAGDVVVSEQ